MAGLKLYEVTNAILDSQHEAVDTEQLDALAIQFESKAVGCACVVKNLTAEVNAIESEIKRLTDLKAVRQNNVDRLKAYIMSCMKAAGIDKVENGVHKLRIVNNSRPSIDVIREEAVPVEFKTEVVDIKIDKDAIWRQVQETGEIPSGIDIRKGQHLRIS